MSISRSIALIFAGCAAVALAAWLMVPRLSAAGTGIARGPWEASFSQAEGLRLSYDGVPVIRRSTLYVIAPGWTAVRYNDTQISHKQTVERGPDGPRLVIEGANDVFRARYEVELSVEAGARVRLSYQLLRDVPAELEY